MDYKNKKAAGQMKDPAGYMAKEAMGKMKPDAVSKMGNYGKKKEGPQMSGGHYKGSVNKMSKELTYGGPVIDQMGNALSHMGAMKVLRHMKSRM